MARKSNIVKKTKNNINLLIIVLLAISWVCAIVTLTDNHEEEEQALLIQTAKGYLEDKLYIRAINNYKTALSDYNTDNNLELERELLAIYLESGMLDEYFELIADRVEQKTATEEEYIALANGYLDESKTMYAIDVLQSGIEQFENEEMIQLKEQIIYEYRDRTINLSDLKQPSADWRIPAFDGIKWGYVSMDGSVLLDFIYDEATPFCNGYAVVKLDGVYTLIDENGYWNAVDKNGLDTVTDISASAIVGVKNGKYRIYSRTFNLLSDEEFDCIYMNDNGLYVVQKAGKWAILSENLEMVTDYIFTDVAVNSQGRVFHGKYAMVKDDGGYFLIAEDGTELYANRFADAKGFEGGLCAVADTNGKWGFANGSAEMIVDFQYGDACSSSCNLAAVEYGGKWGYINRYNNVIIEPEYEQAYPFVEGTAIVKTEMGTFEVLSLKYYDQF